MPDHENTFVLKSDNGREDEFVVEAGDKEDMKSWLAAIRTCMRYSFNYRRSVQVFVCLLDSHLVVSKVPGY